ncbi:QacE [Acinetobacter sp. ANC 4635]|uniref:DUF6232 family protein n=1 Tax=Acinetobacter sp. ANC 4635 TaxID=2529846 RepID=UPI001039086E|nr:DUF6232 family protein [Acinetobacter sp. ANC 4635]TCB31969.1 QacE [Acinetobacter sp. ANC 4635]
MNIYTPQPNEIEFFNHGNTVVTNARFIVDNQTYAMNGVTSVKQGIIPPDRKIGIWMIIVGFIMLLVASGMGKFIGLLILGAGIWLVYKAKPIASVILQSSSGEVQALSSDNQHYISQVVSALNQSIIHRG